MYVVGSYVSYLLISLALTIWVAGTLHKNGRVFLVDAFHGNAELADSVNRTLAVGFSLVSVGWIALTVKIQENVITSPRSSAEITIEKIGGFLLVLGILYFTNLFVLSRMRKRALTNAAPNPMPARAPQV